MRKRILLVDDNMTNLSTGKMALQDTYQVSTVPSGEKALLLLEKVKPDLILLDVDMPDMDGYETIRRIKSNAFLSQIPVIFLTAKNDAESELDGLSLGAVDYITKPFSIPLLHKRIELHLRLQDYSDNLQKMVDEKTEKILKLQDAIMCAVADVYDALISERPYKKPFSHEEAVKIILEGEGSQFDPVLVRLFVGIADEFYSISKEVSSC